MAVSTKKSTSRARALSAHGKLSDNQGVTDALDTVRLKQDERVFEQGKTIDRFYIVRQGLLGIYRHVYPNKKVLIHKIGPGHSTGLSQVMNNTPFPGQLVPIKETVAFEGSVEEVDTLCSNSPADVAQLLARESQMHDDTFLKIDDIIGKDLDVRIARELLDLASRIGKQTEEGIKIIVKLTRKQISEMVGCAQESVIRVMSEWEKNGWIKTDHKYITLTRPHSLKSL